MTIKLFLATIGTLALLSAGTVHAQTTPPPAKTDKAAKTATPPAAKTAKTAKPRTAKSIECSKQADAKGLHGKDRRKFRSECMKS